MTVSTMPDYPAFDFDQVDFVTSDTHFNHARIIELAGRPFSTVEEMDAELIRRWNETVGPTMLSCTSAISRSDRSPNRSH